MKALVIRTLIIVTILSGFAFISLNVDRNSFATVLALFCTVFIFGMACYFSLRGLSKKEINEILYLEWLTKKTGLNFLED